VNDLPLDSKVVGFAFNGVGGFGYGAFPSRCRSSDGLEPTSMNILRLNETQFAPFGISLGMVVASRLGAGPITFCNVVDIVGTGGITIGAEVDCSSDSGSGGGDGALRLDFVRAMMG